MCVTHLKTWYCAIYTVLMKTYSSIEIYITAQPKGVQSKLSELYLLIKKAAPIATEAIKYGMPTFIGAKDLVYFAAMKGHLGFYPTPSAIDAFASELTPYSTSKGCVRFSYDKPLPKTLITKMVKFRAGEDKRQGDKSNLPDFRINKEIKFYNTALSVQEKKIANTLMKIISENLATAESKIWHKHPVWFINENPIVGYSKIKTGIKLMFWSGTDFAEPNLVPGSGKFKDASVIFTDIKEINTTELKRWLKKAQKIQWDYKNIIKRKGKLERLT